MRNKDDKLGQLLRADLKVERLLDRLEDVEALKRIIHEGCVNKPRSAEIAISIVKFLKEG